jgi:hypothetical protein
MRQPFSRLWPSQGIVDVLSPETAPTSPDKSKALTEDQERSWKDWQNREQCRTSKIENIETVFPGDSFPLFSHPQHRPHHLLSPSIHFLSLIICNIDRIPFPLIDHFLL